MFHIFTKGPSLPQNPFAPKTPIIYGTNFAPLKTPKKPTKSQKVGRGFLKG
eukprot:SAG22_NODE_773_length_7297_cov_102.041539_8_plen_51_part_00